MLGVGRERERMTQERGRRGVEGGGHGKQRRGGGRGRGSNVITKSLSTDYTLVRI